MAAPKAKIPPQVSETFVASDFLDVPAVLARLRDDNDSLSRHLIGKFEPGARKRIQGPSVDAKDADSVAAMLAAEFNRIAQGPSIFDEQAFAHVDHALETKRLLDQRPRGKRVAKLNAMLLKDAFPPTELLRNYTKSPKLPVERVQTGVRIEKRLLKVLKALAEYEDLSLGELIEEIMLHVFVGAPGLSRGAQKRVAALKEVYNMDYDAHASVRFVEGVAREG